MKLFERRVPNRPLLIMLIWDNKKKNKQTNNTWQFLRKNPSPSFDLFFRLFLSPWPSLPSQATKFWRTAPTLLSSLLDGGGEFIALIVSKMFSDAKVVAYFSSINSSSRFSRLPSFAIPFSFSQSWKSSRSASSTTFMLRPGEQIVTEGKGSSVTGLAASWWKMYL